jgi:hypothetical protein
MATRSRIGILKEDGSIKSIYCHWDGYPDNNGKILIESYSDKEKVEKLLEKGDMSSLQDAIHRCEYYVDRGETDVSAGVYKSLEEYRSIREEYQYYIDQNNRWWYNHYGSTFTPLEDYFRNKNVEDEEE